jgi:hypothetical protein
MSRKIEIMCVGAQKSGTTSLHDILKNHPQIELPYIKELYYFTDDREYRSIKNFHKHYKFDENKVAMNITPNNMCHPKAMERIYQYNPNMKIIVMLREPISRVISQFKMKERVLLEKRSFKEVVNDEIDNLRYKTQDCKSYVWRSLYHHQINKILSIFPKEQVYFVLFEDYAKDQKTIVNEILQWCGLESFEFEPINSNKGFYPKKSLLWKMLMMIPRKMFSQWVRKDAEPPLIDQDSVNKLKEFFIETINETEKLTGLNCSVWREAKDKSR